MIGRSAGHTSDSDLIRLGDGQLPARRSRRVEQHLAACAPCRARAEVLRSASEALKEICAAPPPRPAGFEHRFEQRLRRAAVQSVRTRQAPTRFAWPAFARILIPACLTIFVVLWLLPQRRTVSAETLLMKAGEAQSARAAAARRPVAMQRLRIRSNSASEVVEIWRDAGAGAVRRRGGGDLWNELRAIQREYQGREEEILSAADFARWRSDLESPRDEVSRERSGEGVNVLVLRTSAPPDESRHVLESGLVVRESDWLPLSRSFRVADGAAVREYSLSELEFVTVARADIPRDLFPDIANTLERAPVPAPPVAPPPAAVDLQELEDQVRYAVHRARLCLSGAVTAKREENSVLLTGAVDSTSELETLRALLPLSDALINTVQASSPERPPASGDAGAGLANQMVTLARRARLESWEIARLTAAPPAPSDVAHVARSPHRAASALSRKPRTAVTGAAGDRQSTAPRRTQPAAAGR